MPPDWTDADAILKEMATMIDMMPEETEAVYQRLLRLAASTVPPVWGYAGMLLALAKHGHMDDVFQVYAEINMWRDDPAHADELFQNWNAERLAK